MGNKTLSVKTKDAIYEIQFGQAQIEITGRCNMFCKHCRAENEIREDMPIEQVMKIVNFFKQHSMEGSEVVLSGGEPLMHKKFFALLRAIRKGGCDIVVMTTNGSLVNAQHLDFIGELDFRRFIFSVSLDGLNADDHDNFRGFKGAYNGVAKTLRLISERADSKIITSLRVTVFPNTINLMESFVQFAINSDCRVVSFSSVYPIGRAKEKKELWMSQEQKHEFIKNIYMLNRKYDGQIRVSTNDPLKCIEGALPRLQDCNKMILDGCTAASATFNVCSNGDMTPCALFELPIMNIFKLSNEEIIHNYQKSKVVANLLSGNLLGKCKDCLRRRQCGGCRARAVAINGNYLAEDPDCWI